MKKELICLFSVLLLAFSGISVGAIATEDLGERATPVSQDETAEVPVLTIGDSWTFHQNLWSNESEDQSVFMEEEITYTVSAIEEYEYQDNTYYGYNLTMDGEIIDGHGKTDILDFEIDSGRVEGYLFLRMSDLGTVVDYQWRKMNGTAEGNNMTTWQETTVHDDPVVEDYDFPVHLGEDFYANTTKRSKNHVKVEFEGSEVRNETTYENNTVNQKTEISPTTQEVSVDAGTFDTFELNRSLSEDDDGYVRRNYAPEVKFSVEERADLNNTDWQRELLSYDITDRSESLSLSPASGIPDEEVEVSGSFPDHPNEEIKIRLPEAGEEYDVTADDNGEFSKNITVPDVSDRTPAGGEKGSIGVIAELSSDPTEAYEVSTLTIEGAGGAEYYNLDVNVDGEGSVESDPDQDKYEEGTQVTLTAMADEGWSFDEWTGDYEGTENEITIEMDGDKTVTAHFMEEPSVINYELSIDSSEGGEVVAPGEGTHEYEEEKVVDLEAVADEGYEFIEWTGDIENIEDAESNETTIEMLDNYSITAVFEEDVVEYDLTINLEGKGSTDPSEGTHTYQEGEEVTITATADEGWNFKEWTGTEETGEEITISMDEDKEITATFEEDDGDDGGGGIPGFTSSILVLALGIALVIFYMKIETDDR